jgi:hypothetical protein
MPVGLALLRRLASGLSPLVLLALANCGSSDGYSASGVAGVATAEWRRYGGGTVVYGPGSAGTTPPKGHETSEPLASRIGEYWRTAGQGKWNGRDTDKPWSGALVVWVMSKAGVSPADFPHTARHSDYLSALVDKGASARFIVRDRSAYAVQPGDLVCSGRGPTPGMFRNSTTLKQQIRTGVDHCDIVVDVRGGYAHAVGGNVRDTITMSLYPLDRGGRLADVRGKTWFCVVENRWS